MSTEVSDEAILAFIDGALAFNPAVFDGNVGENDIRAGLAGVMALLAAQVQVWVTAALGVLAAEVEDWARTHNPACRCEWEAGVVHAADAVRAALGAPQPPVWYRTGGDNGRAVYARIGGENLQADRFLGIMDSGEMAAKVVAALNATGQLL